MWHRRLGFDCLGQEGYLEEGITTHSSILAWRIPRIEEPGRPHPVHGVAKSRTRLSDFTFTSLSMHREPLSYSLADLLTLQLPRCNAIMHNQKCPGNYRRKLYSCFKWQVKVFIRMSYLRLFWFIVLLQNLIL